MFESLQEGLSSALRTLSGKARLTESNMRDGLRLVQQSLLEADVSFPVVKQFMDRVSEQAVGEQVLKSLRPEQQVVGIVYNELVNLMGPGRPLAASQTGPDRADDVRAARLGQNDHLRQAGADADRARPQANACGGRLAASGGRPPIAGARRADRRAGLCRRGRDRSRGRVPECTETSQIPGREVLILDTAGRLHIDEELMQQLQRIDRRVNPDQVYLVVDAMTGQDAVNSAKAFNEALELDGCIMTKLDGDARGGAALSVKAVTGVPLKFMGTGEHLDALEEFHPDRMASRILGMGDVLTLVEQAQQKFDQDEMQKQEERLRRGEFTLDDFRKQLSQIGRLGPLNKVMGMIPGMGGLQKMMGDVDADSDMKRLVGIIDSMTADERRNPSKTIDQSRRRRIAVGAGVEPAEVNQLVKQFDGMADIMKRMAGMGIRERMREVQQLQRGGFLDPGSSLSRQKKGTGKRLSAEDARI